MILDRCNAAPGGNLVELSAQALAGIDGFRDLSHEDRAAVARRGTVEQHPGNHLTLSHREAVTRELNGLVQSGLLEKKKRTLTVTDMLQLVKMVEEVGS
jgi:hypothetical protein